MTLPLKVDMLRAMYAYLCETPPFDRLHMPESEDVKFVVGKRVKEFARYHWDGKSHVITISSNGVGHTYTLAMKMSHEMVHLYLEENDMESRAHSAEVHNGAFRVLAREVCKYHGYDYKAFF